MYIVLVLICCKERLGVFIRLGSFSVIFISMMVIFVIGMGIYEISVTEYQVGNMALANETNF